jgi:3-phosphoshikimate 1-carboxyvinyltransferase
MALAFAPACQIVGPIAISDPMVITKSYPGYWEDIKKVGFEIGEGND